MVQPLKLALIGIDHPHGAAWRELLTHFADQVQVVAIVPAFGGSTTSLEEKYARLPQYSSVEDLLQSDTRFDAALVALANHETPAAVAALAKGGKHLLVEKPAARSASEWQKAVEAVTESHVAFQSGYLWRYDEGAERLRAMVEHGRFGRLISVEMTYVTSDVRRRGADHYLFDKQASGGGFFNWLGCHYLDLLNFVVRETVVGVTARVDVFGTTAVDVEDGGSVILDLKNGAVVTFVGGYWIPRWTGESHWTIRGSERWVHWKPTSGSGVLEIHGPQPHWHAMEEVFSLPADSTPGYGGYRGVRLIRDWLEAIQQVKPCRNTVHTVAATLEILDAIYQSSASGRRVECHIEPRE